MWRSWQRTFSLSSMLYSFPTENAKWFIDFSLFLDHGWAMGCCASGRDRMAEKDNGVSLRPSNEGNGWKRVWDRGGQGEASGRWVGGGGLGDSGCARGAVVTRLSFSIASKTVCCQESGKPSIAFHWSVTVVATSVVLATMLCSPPCTHFFDQSQCPKNGSKEIKDKGEITKTKGEYLGMVGRWIKEICVHTVLIFISGIILISWPTCEMLLNCYYHY